MPTFTSAARAQTSVKAELDESRGWLDTLVMVSPLVWSTAPDGKLCYINQRVLDYTGRTLADLVRRGWEDLIHPDDHGEVIATWSHAAQTGSSCRLRHRLRRADGEYRRFAVQAEPLLDSEDRVIQIFGLHVDIDENTAPSRKTETTLPLSARERTIVRMMGQGFSNKGIARQLSIAPETVKSHAKSIFWKLTVRSRAEAVYRAAALGLI